MKFRNLRPRIDEDDIAANERLRAVGRKNLQTTLELARREHLRRNDLWLNIAMLMALLLVLAPVALILWARYTR